MEPPITRYIVRSFLFAVIGTILGYSTDFIFSEIAKKYMFSPLEKVVFHLLVNVIIIYYFNTRLIGYFSWDGETLYESLFLTVMFFRAQPNSGVANTEFIESINKWVKSSNVK
jgi:hypothetical protein